MDNNNVRQVYLITDNWLFTKANDLAGNDVNLDDSNWEKVTVPHDWAIEGPFARKNDIQYTKVIEDGEETSLENTGRTGGLPHTGTGWYRKRFTLPSLNKNQRLFIEFDGVMSNSTVFLNGKNIGHWPYGYSSFSFELTENLLFAEENLLAVKVEPKPFASRWYPGAGIYRNVRLIVTNDIYINQWGTYITTPQISTDQSLVNIKTEVNNKCNCATNGELTTTIISPTGQQINEVTTENIINNGINTFNQELVVPKPMLWDIDKPQLYKAISTIKVNNKDIDRYETLFGVRSVDFDTDKGFFLNGKNRKLQGVCLHHDLGALGAAVSHRAIERQLEILQDMGCNAIRTSHNPPTPELLNLCDKMGFLVIDEAFDEWKNGKCDNGYHILFDEWAEKDLQAMIRRDRNHPSVIMWSIGNEIREQREKEGANVAKFLTNICHDLDPARPVTAGFNIPDEAIKNGLVDAVDIPGWNYKPHLYEKYHQEHPDWIMYGSETSSCVSSRGEYYFPVVEEKGTRRSTLHCNSYDMTSPPWGYAPDYEFQAQDDCPFIFGEFVWTGFDYLGEPTPYKTEWPSRSSYFGIVDLCGIPKDRFYLYRSKWSNKETLHLLPHWNWQEKENIPVHCYTNYDSAELFLNGRSLGIKRKDPSSIFGRYRLIWENVSYEPGELKVVAFDSHGNPASERIVWTAGSPENIQLIPDRKEISADGSDLCFITVQIVDENNNLCPVSRNMISFEVDGPATIVAVDNGDQTSTEPFIATYRKAFNGKCMLILRSQKNQAGEILITAKSDDLNEAKITITSK